MKVMYKVSIGNAERRLAIRFFEPIHKAVRFRRYLGFIFTRCLGDVAVTTLSKPSFGLARLYTIWNRYTIYHKTFINILQKTASCLKMENDAVERISTLVHGKTSLIGYVQRTLK